MNRNQANPGQPHTDKVDREHYDQSGYFEDHGTHLQDPSSRFHRYRVRKVLEIYTPSPDDRVVDLGCGWGTFCFALGAQVRGIVGVDFSAKSIELCESRLAEEPQAEVRFLQADARNTGLDSGGYDVVIAADFFEHLYPDDSVEVVREAFRILRPGGRFVIWTPHRGHFLEILKNNDILLKRDVTHVDYKSMARLRAMLEGAGFGIEKIYYAESHLPVLGWLEKRLQAVVPFMRRRIAVLAQKGPTASI